MTVTVQELEYRKCFTHFPTNVPEIFNASDTKLDNPARLLKKGDPK